MDMSPACSIAALLLICMLPGAAVARRDPYGDGPSASPDSGPSEDLVIADLRSPIVRLLGDICQRLDTMSLCLRVLRVEQELADVEALPRSAEQDITKFNYNPFGLRFGRHSGQQSPGARWRAGSECALGRQGCRLIITKYKLQL